MNQTQISTSVRQLPENWDDVAGKNIFLSTQYLTSLELSAPINMSCFFLGIYRNDVLIGVAIAQLLKLSDVKSFGERDSCVKTRLRSFAFKQFGTNVLLLGNNMLTGQNAYRFSNDILQDEIPLLLQDAFNTLRTKLRKSSVPVHITIWKDFLENEIRHFQISSLKDYFTFSTQPNMLFRIPANWTSEIQYVETLQKKYRDQYKRARKKAVGIVRAELTLSELTTHRDSIYQLYMDVAQNAPFNTFYLHKDHFINLKKSLGDNFIVHGYYENGNLLCFSTMIKNDRDIDTYFLGYSEKLQKDKMLYLNMLYDMLMYSIEKGYRRIIFSRTALEIKSSVGAKAVPMYGLIKHRNPLLNKLMPKIFGYFEPKVIWTERHPFRVPEPQPSSASE